MDGARWLSDEEQRAWRKLMAVTTLLPSALECQLQRDADLSLFAYWVLAMLSEAPERSMPMSELAARSTSSPSRLSHVVAKLEDRGWVRRLQSPVDTRVNVAELTEAGARPGRPMAAVAGLSETGGGALLALGLLTPVAGAVVVGTLLVAASTHLDKGVWAANGGYELPVLVAVVGATLALTGPGAVSLDAAVGLDDNWSTALGTLAVAAGIAAAATVVIRARWALRADARRATAGAQADPTVGVAA